MSRRFAAALAAAAALALAPAFAADRMLGPELATRIGAGGFEFRGFGRTTSGFENMIWRFSPDGKVTGEAAMSGRLISGGMAETFGMKNAGTWRRQGESLCIQWDAGNRRFSGRLIDNRYFGGRLIDNRRFGGRLIDNGDRINRNFGRLGRGRQRHRQRLAGGRHRHDATRFGIFDEILKPLVRLAVGIVVIALVEVVQQFLHLALDAGEDGRFVVGLQRLDRLGQQRKDVGPFGRRLIGVRLGSRLRCGRFCLGRCGN